jgi:ATP adenylyltransferase/5',5'''-P-1,P-4-tetraphosphate phosphorylase II
MATANTFAIDSLFDQQLNHWELAHENYAGLQNVVLKTIPFKDHGIKVQYNPKRIISSSAKIDPHSVSQRPCFLCEHNRPPKQQGINYKNDFIMLVNPYPVFKRHLTIPTVQHQPQYIQGKFGTMLQLAGDLPDFSIIYNGPECGASAPDHFHFQAIQRGVLPIETDFSTKKKCLFLGRFNGIEIFTWDNYLRKLITISGYDVDALEGLFVRLYGILANMLQSAGEPMMNMLVQCDHDKWIVHIFPRKQHRPRQYFETGEKQLLLSPASIDMGGILIMPREEDFNKITRSDIADIYKQVCVDDVLIRVLVESLSDGYDVT